MRRDRAATLLRPGGCARPWLKRPKPWAVTARRTPAGDRSGAAAVEFALIAPVLLLLMVGTAVFGITVNNYIMLTEATRNGGRLLALSRGATTPRTTAVNAIKAAAPNLTAANLTITTSVNGTLCSTDATCSTALSTAAGLSATVTASYPCQLVVMGHDFAPGCTLSSSISEMVE